MINESIKRMICSQSTSGITFINMRERGGREREGEKERERERERERDAKIYKYHNLFLVHLLNHYVQQKGQ